MGVASADPASVGQEEALDDIELSRHTHELLELVELEGGVNLTLKGSFEDEYGEIHDWNSDVVTHHYLCRQLYLHYILHVRGGGGIEEGRREGGRGGEGRGGIEEGNINIGH